MLLTRNLSDMIGRTHVILPALLARALGSLVMALADSLPVLSVPPHERGKLISALSMSAYSETVPTISIGYPPESIGLTAALGCAALIASIVPGRDRRLYTAVIPPGRSGASGA